MSGAKIFLCALLMTTGIISGSWLEARGIFFGTRDSSYILNILDKLKSGQNIIFTKYGDGEYLCMVGTQGHNVDHDSYHDWLGKALKNALVSLSKKPNTYIGQWWTAEVYEFCNRLAKRHGVEVPWVWYHLFMNDNDFLNHDYMYKFVEFLVTTRRKKILICNSMNSKLKNFFRADVYIEIPAQNWSFNYQAWKNIAISHVEKDCIVLISGGLCTKVLIDDITNGCDVTCIDLGSSFDLLARGNHSRPWSHSYQDELKYYKDFIPQDW